MATPSKDVRSHWEAGVALVYGEIDELLNQLEKLREDLPGIVEAGTRNLNTSIIAIVKATKGAQATIAGYGDAQEQRLAALGAKEREQLSAVARQILDEVARSAAESARLVPAKGKRRWLLLLAAAIGLALAGAGGAYLGASFALRAPSACHTRTVASSP